MNKYKIIVQENGQETKIHHCESFLLLMDAGEDDMSAQASLRGDIDTIRILAICYRSIIEMLIKTGAENGIEDECNKKRIKMILDEGIRQGLIALPTVVGGQHEPLQ